MRASWIMVAGLALALGCGGTSSSRPSANGEIPLDPVPPPGEGGGALPTATPDPAAPPCDGKVTLRLRGLQLEPDTQAVLEVGAVEVRRDGQPVPTSFAARGPVRFPVSGAYRMAVLPLDVGGGPMEATFHVERFTWCDPGDSCAAAPVCGASIAFRYDPAKVRRDNCHVVVALDMAGSFLPTYGETPLGVTFVPHYSVQC